MPELRHDMVTGHPVLIAPGRAFRPHRPSADRASRSDPPQPPDCPFCPGREHDTPPEITRIGTGAPGAPGWRVRVFPNLYPIVDATLASTGAAAAHEVIVLSQSHNRSFGMLSEDEAVEVTAVLADRVRANTVSGSAYVQVLLNHGRAGGASVDHPHAQVVALDFVPPAVASALARYERADTDPVAADLDLATTRGLQLVDGAAPAWCPWASPSPYAVRIAPRDAVARFEESDAATLTEVAHSLRAVLRSLATALGDPPYNMIVRSAPPAPSDPYHWHLEVVPRTTTVGGFELGTGVDVNVVDPELAVRALRRGLAG